MDNEKYIFVSYSHQDSPKVLPVIAAMKDAGFRVWYDSGIEAGTEWPEYIEDRLTNAETVLIFMTPAAVASRNCRNEINFALELKKEILVAYLEETELAKGMRLQLNSSQSLFRQNHISDEAFVNSLLNARILQSCRELPAPVAEVPATPTPAPAQWVPPARPVTPISAQPVRPAAKPTKAKSKVWIPIVVVAAVLTLVLGMSLWLNWDSWGKLFSKAPSGPVLSEDPRDYTLELDGIVYQLPCDVYSFTLHNWSGADSSAVVQPGDEDYIELVKGDKRIGVEYCNPTDSELPLIRCKIIGIAWESTKDPGIKLAKGITVNSTVDEIIAAYGEPDDRHEDGEYVILTYWNLEAEEENWTVFQVSKDPAAADPYILVFNRNIAEAATNP